MAKASKASKVTKKEPDNKALKREPAPDYPTTISIISDGNELAFKDTIKINGETRYIYVYTKSLFKKGLELIVTKDELSKLIETNRIFVQK